MKKSILLFFVFAHLISFGQNSKLSDFITNIYVINGDTLVEIRVPGSPPPDVLMPLATPNRSAVFVPNVPAFNWCYGCSATSGAMIAGSYDNNNYPNMYSGPGNGGLVPMTNSIWGYGECPLSATHQGKDGLTVRGHVDDYWVSSGSSQPDPYITGGWTQHLYGNCTADFMGTNQSALGSIDGSTTFYLNPSGNKLYDPQAPSGSMDGCAGVRDFFESRGYEVISNFTQLIPGAYGNTNGFSFAEYKAEIDAGRAVMIHVTGHTMVGYGYDVAGQIVYIRDTWDHYSHQMTWGGSYSGMDQWGVSVFQLEPQAQYPEIVVTPTTINKIHNPAPQVTSQTLSISNTGSASLVWNINLSGNWLSVNTSSGSVSPGNTQYVSLSLNSAGLSTGTYNGSVSITSNDPDTPLLAIPVTLQVITAVILNPPTNLTAEALGSNVSLSWQPPNLFKLNGLISSYRHATKSKLTDAAYNKTKLAPPSQVAADSKSLLGYKLYRNGSEIAGGITATEFYDLNLEPGTYNYYVIAIYDAGDSEPSNTATVTIEGGTPGIIAELDFENVADWSLTFDPWTSLDVDMQPTYGITNVTFPNSGAAMAYLAFNPDSTDPPMGSDTELQPHSGERFGAVMASVPSSGGNDDWLISPKVILGDNSLLDMYAKSYITDYGMERFKIGVSTTSMDPSDFTIISASPYISVPADWTHYTFDLSVYDGQEVYVGIQCVSYDAFIFMVDDIKITSEIQATSHFSPVWSSPYNPMTFKILQANIEELPMQEGDEVGLFDVDPSNGVEICVGVGVLPGQLGGGVKLEMIASMNDGSPGQANGFTPGNSIIYKFWNEDSGEITNVTANYPFSGFDEVYTSLGLTIVKLSGTNSPGAQQIINLNPGWAGISSYLQPANPNMADVMSGISGQLEMICNLGGFYQPGNGASTLNTWSAQSAYFIKVNQEAELILLGNVAGTTTVNLIAGWNLIPVLSNQAVDIETLFAGNLTKVCIVKDVVGLKVFWPEKDINTLLSLTPGYSYLIKVSEDFTIEY